MSYRRFRAASLVVLALSGLSGCGDPRPLYVDGASVALAVNKDAPSAGYFTVHGGAVPVVLRDVTADAAIRLEMHDSVMKGGVMKMERLDSVEIPAKGDVRFAPGGRHLMIWGINPAAAAQGKMTLTFIFSNGDRILVDAAIRRTGGGKGVAM